jgi:hypothetical protein
MATPAPQTATSAGAPASAETAAWRRRAASCGNGSRGPVLVWGLFPSFDRSARLRRTPSKGAHTVHTSA